MRVTRITSYPPSSIGFASTCSTAGKTLTPWLSILSAMLLFLPPIEGALHGARTAGELASPGLRFVRKGRDWLPHRGSHCLSVTKRRSHCGSCLPRQGRAAEDALDHNRKDGTSYGSNHVDPPAC